MKPANVADGNSWPGAFTGKQKALNTCEDFPFMGRSLVSRAADCQWFALKKQLQSRSYS